MNSQERHEARYQRRKAAREKKLHDRSNAVGTLSEAFSYSHLYFCGKNACKGVRWKTSTKNFELRLFSRTSRTRRKLLKKNWKCKRPCTFIFPERGHLRKIDAPHIVDRQVHKAVCRYVLRPLYYPHLIYDNGASMEGKGFSFAINRILYFLRRWYRRYGTEGYIVTIDFKGYFPNAPHDTIEEIHRRYIFNDDHRELVDYLLNAFGPVGMALGVEPSQTEAVMLANAVDHALKDQAGVKDLERYMDDTLFIVHTKQEAYTLVEVARQAAVKIGLVMNDNKTHITPLTGWFKYCQWRFHLEDTGRVVIKPSRRSVTVMNHKLNSFARMVDAGIKTVREVYLDYGCFCAYIARGDSHNILLKTNRHFYRLFGFFPKKGVLPDDSIIQKQTLPQRTNDEGGQGYTGIRAQT